MIFLHILFGLLKETKESSSEGSVVRKGREEGRLNVSVKINFCAVHHHVWNDCALIVFVITYTLLRAMLCCYVGVHKLSAHFN